MVNVTIGDYIPWLKQSTLQWMSIYHDWNCQRYNRWVHTISDKKFQFLSRWLEISTFEENIDARPHVSRVTRRLVFKSHMTLHSRPSRSLHACRAYNIINGQMYTITETINVTIDEYIPWLKLSTLQYVSIFHDWNCQRYNR
jgi:hypothetical protein